MKVLLTGGCGFIGSHQAVVLLQAGHDVVVVDDLSNSRATVIDRIAEVAGRRPEFVQLDVRNTEMLTKVLRRSSCDSIIHFAGLKHVGESMQRPVDYLDVNVAGLTSLLKAADETGVRHLIFSSSGSIYGNASRVPISEDDPIEPTNPYSRSKAICEQILSTLCAVDESWSIVALRYFNPSGAHPGGLIGEDPTHLVSNIVPVLMEAVAGELPSVTINGTDFDTHDGTAVRDYIHVMDVAAAHAAALSIVTGTTGFEALNIGRGEGVSVLDLVSAAEETLGRDIQVETGPRRPGDVPALVADTTRGRDRLGLSEYQGLEAIFRDAWRFRVGRTA